MNFIRRYQKLIALCAIALLGLSILINPSVVHADSLTKAVDDICKGPWKTVLSLVDYFAVIVLIVISFVNILGLKIDAYAIKKALPMLVLGLILANLSWFICMMFIDFSELLISWGYQQANINNNFLQNFLSSVTQPLAGVTSLAALGALILAVIYIPIATPILLIAGLVVVLVFAILAILVWLLMWIRGYYIMVLVIFAPLAFMAMSIPLTQNLFKKWLSEFLKWVFVGPLIYFLFYVLHLIDNSLSGPNSPAKDHFLAHYILVCGGLFAAISLPFTLSGGLAKSLWTGATGLAKKAGGWAGKTAYNATPIPYHVQGINEMLKLRQERAHAKDVGTGRAIGTAWGQGVDTLLSGQGLGQAFKTGGASYRTEKEKQDIKNQTTFLDRKLQSDCGGYTAEKIPQFRGIFNDFKNSTSDPNYSYNEDQIRQAMAGLAHSGVLTDDDVKIYNKRKDDEYGINKKKNAKKAAEDRESARIWSEYLGGKNGQGGINSANAAKAIALGYAPRSVFSAMADSNEIANSALANWMKVGSSQHDMERLLPVLQKLIDNTDFRSGVDSNGTFALKDGSGRIHAAELTAVRQYLEAQAQGTTHGARMISQLDGNGVKGIDFGKYDLSNVLNAPNQHLHLIKDADLQRIGGGLDMNDADIKTFSGFHSAYLDKSDVDMANPTDANFYNQNKSQITKARAGLDKIIKKINTTTANNNDFNEYLKKINTISDLKNFSNQSFYSTLSSPDDLKIRNFVSNVIHGANIVDKMDSIDQQVKSAMAKVKKKP